MIFEQVLTYLREKRTNRARLPSWRGLYHLRVVHEGRKPSLVIFSDEDDGWHYAELKEEELMSDDWEAC